PRGADGRNSFGPERGRTRSVARAIGPDRSCSHPRYGRTGYRGKMNLALDIAITHVRARARQTVIAIFSVATGVGFAIMIAAMLEGTENDFIDTLVDTI